MSDELLELDAGEIAARVGAGSLSAVEVARFFLARVEADNPLVNALCTVADSVLDEAAACDARIAAGLSARPLEGVPFVVKDIIDTRGLRTTSGSLVHRDRVPDEDAVAVERLRAAGAVLLGKTNTPEFAHDINTHNHLFGTTRNPCDLNRTAGGSSGGTAAAIAAGMAPIGLGTDLGGSIRIPGAFCGVPGIRPVPGRVPVYPAEFGWDTLVEHVQGPMARSVADVGLMLSVLAGPDDRDPSSLPAQQADYRRAADATAPLAGRRLAYCEDLNGLARVEPAVAERVRAAMKVFESLGCIVEADCFDASDVKSIRAGTRGFGMVARYAGYAQTAGHLMTTTLRRQVAEGMLVDLRTVTEAERLRTRYWHTVRRFLQRFDFIVTPAVGAVAFELDRPLEPGWRDHLLFSYAFSVTGLPAAVVPCGGTAAGLPVALQIIGHRLREDQVLEAASAFAAAAPDTRLRPGVNRASLAWMTATPLTDFP